MSPSGPTGTFQLIDVPNFQVGGIWTKRSLEGTPPKFNIAPEKWWLEGYFPIGKLNFQGLC